MLPRTGCAPLWNTSSASITVLGEEQAFSMYSISQLRFSHEAGISSQWINLNVMLSRRFESYLLTSIIPCIVLVALGQITLTHFGLDDFQDRVTITIALLIVIALFFSQVVANLPSSPIPKVLEMIFFYCIIRLAYIYIQHSAIDKMLRKGSYRRSILMKTNKICVKSAKETRTMSANVIENPEANINNDSIKPMKNFVFCINAVGSCVAFFVDLAVVSAIVVLVMIDKINKNNLFQSYNRTELSIDK